MADELPGTVPSGAELPTAVKRGVPLPVDTSSPTGAARRVFQDGTRPSDSASGRASRGKWRQRLTRKVSSMLQAPFHVQPNRGYAPHSGGGGTPIHTALPPALEVHAGSVSTVSPLASWVSPVGATRVAAGAARSPTVQQQMHLAATPLIGSRSGARVLSPRRVAPATPNAGRSGVFPRHDSKLAAEDAAFREMIFGRSAVDVDGKDFDDDDQVIRERWIIHPDSKFRRIWNIITMLLVLILLFWVPFDLGFGFSASGETGGFHSFMEAVDLLMDVFFIVDILLNFRTAVLDDGELIQKPAAVARRYLSGWFGLDLIATIPYERFLSLGISDADLGGNSAVAKLPRILRFLRLIRLMRLVRLLKLRSLLDQWEELGVFASGLWRISSIVFWMVVVAHLLACGWFFVADMEGLGMDTWAGQYNLQSDQATFNDKYSVSMYWAFVTVTTVGYGDVIPVSQVERQFVMMCTFVGNLVMAYMIGKFTAMAARVDAAGQVYQAKLDEINEFMRFHRLPKSLRQRVRSFYETFWARQVYFNERNILSELTFSLRRDVAFFLKREILTSVPFFQDADPNFVQELIGMLEDRFCGAGEVIIEHGSVAREMFILKRGEVVVLDGHGVPSHHLGDGAFFGEVALLEANHKRTAWVKSVTPCEMYTLTKERFDSVLEAFPEFREAMLAIAQIRLHKFQDSTSRNLLDSSMLPSGVVKVSPDAAALPSILSFNVSVMARSRRAIKLPPHTEADDAKSGGGSVTSAPAPAASQPPVRWHLPASDSATHMRRQVGCDSSAVLRSRTSSGGGGDDEVSSESKQHPRAGTKGPARDPTEVSGRQVGPGKKGAGLSRFQRHVQRLMRQQRAVKAMGKAKSASRRLSAPCALPITQPVADTDVGAGAGAGAGLHADTDADGSAGGDAAAMSAPTSAVVSPPGAGSAAADPADALALSGRLAAIESKLDAVVRLLGELKRG